MYKLKIKKYRKVKKYTQWQLSHKIRISQNFLSEIEHQKYDIRLSLLFKIGQALKVCPKDLIDCTCNCEECFATTKKIT